MTTNYKYGLFVPYLSSDISYTEVIVVTIDRYIGIVVVLKSGDIFLMKLTIRDFLHQAGLSNKTVPDYCTLHRFQHCNNHIECKWNKFACVGRNDKGMRRQSYLY